MRKRILWDFMQRKKKSLDVVFIGSSSMWCSLNPLIMYEETGFKSYNIATSAQRPSSLKYLAREAQKYQPTALYVIDVSNFAYDYTVWDEQNEGSLRRVTDGLKYSWNRLLCNHEQITGKSDKLSYYFDIFKYHLEYKNFFRNISHWNFDKENETKGWLYNDEVTGIPYYEPNLNVDPSITIDIRAEEELSVLLDYCDNSEANYLFIFSMTSGAEDQMRYISNIINNRGYEVLCFYDFWHEIGMDETKDFYAPRHVNVLGAEKTSRFFARYLHEKYNLKEHRDNKWDDLAQSMEDMISVGKNKIYSGNYIEPIQVELLNIDNDKITFVNVTKSPVNLVYAWYVHEIVGESADVIDMQWYLSDNTFTYEYDKNKEYSITAFVQGSENKELGKYKNNAAKLRYDYQLERWCIEFE